MKVNTKIEKKKLDFTKILEQIKKYKIYVLILITILAFGIYIGIINYNSSQNNKYVEVSFMTPTQAVVFWTSDNEALGFAKYGTSKYKRDIIEKQTSSTPGNIHVVIIDSIPDKGIYVSLHEEKENPLIIKKIHHIKYSENIDINE